MNYAMVQTLILKDWYLQRWLILGCFGGGLVSLAVIAFGGNIGFIFGLILLITALVALSGQLAVAAIVGERKEQTLPFVMTLPISYREYTTAKILGNLIIFFMPWALMLAGSVALLYLSPKSGGLIPYTVVMGMEILLNACLLVSVAVVTESQAWTIGAIITGNIGVNVIGYCIAHLKGILDWMWGSSAHWNASAYAALGAEFALAAMMVGLTFFIQSRKKDFL